jgi:hypothetical protein
MDFKLILADRFKDDWNEVTSKKYAYIYTD